MANLPRPRLDFSALKPGEKKNIAVRCVWKVPAGLEGPGRHKQMLFVRPDRLACVYIRAASGPRPSLDPKRVVCLLPPCVKSDIIQERHP